MFQHDRFLTQEVSFQLRQLPMLKRPSIKWQNTLKNGTMKHIEEEVLRLLTNESILELERGRRNHGVDDLMPHIEEVRYNRTLENRDEDLITREFDDLIA
ncbi:hypothetical protein Tco_0830201 [Tanacetum coccineum]